MTIEYFIFDNLVPSEDLNFQKIRSQFDLDFRDFVHDVEFPSYRTKIKF